MANKSNVSLSVIRRLPRYYRFLGELIKSGCLRISSKELSQRMGLGASQIRQDLNCFGGFGQQGYGYNVESLHSEIKDILGLNKKLDTIFIGCGNLGKAILTSMDFDTLGYNIIGIFEKDKNIIGQSFLGLKVLSDEVLDDFCKKNRPAVAIICIPKKAAEDMSDELIGYGIKGFLNFSHYDLALNNDNIVVENIHISDSLLTLHYRVNEAIKES